MEYHPLNQRTLLLLTTLAAVLLVLSFAVGYYHGLSNAPQPPPPKALAEELLTAFLETPKQDTTPAAAIPVEEGRADPRAVKAIPPPAIRPALPEDTVRPHRTEQAPEPSGAAAATTPAAPPTTAPPPRPAKAAVATPITPTPAATPDRDTSPIVGYSVQIGSYGEQANADESVDRWRRAGYPAFVYHTTSSAGRRWHTVRIGRFDRRDQAAKMARRLRGEKGVQAVTVPLVRR